MDEKELTPEQKIIKSLAEQRLMTDATVIAPALADADIAERIINKYGDVVEECDHEPLSDEEIQVVFDNDEEQKKEA